MLWKILYLAYLLHYAVKPITIAYNFPGKMQFDYFTLSFHGWLQMKSGPPVDKGRKLNVHKTFRRRPGRLLNVLCTFNLRPVSTGIITNTEHNEDTRTTSFRSFGCLYYQLWTGFHIVFVFALFNLNK